MLDYLLYLSLKIEPIFYKIIYMSIIASFVGIAILIVKKMLKNKISPIWISRIWIMFIISLIIPIQIKSPISIYNHIPISEDLINYSLDEFIKSERINFPENSEKEVLEKMEVSADVGTKIEFPNVIIEKERSNSYRIRQFIPIIWGLIVITAIFAYILTYIVFENKIRKYKSKNEKIELILKKCKEELKIKNKINLIQQDVVKMPALFGIFNIRILVNDNILNLSDEEIRYVFIHELCHYKRKDNILNVLITILRVIYFFNPIIWISLNAIKDDLEVATDEFAMKNENKETQKEYSKTLVKLSVINSDKFLIQTICMSDGKRDLERRIDSMKKIERFKNKKTIIISVSIIIFIILLFCSTSSNYITQEEIYKLYNSVQDIDNIYLKVEELSFRTFDSAYNSQYTNDNGNVTIIDCYFKDNVYIEKKVLTENNSLIYTYKNFDTNEGITIAEENKQIEIYSVNSYENNNTIWDKFFISLDTLNQKYKYCGIENINGIDCYCIIFKQTNQDCKYMFWIDKDSGCVIKADKELNDKNNGIRYIKLNNVKYEINKVSDDDIKKPNIEEYEGYEIIYK